MGKFAGFLKRMKKLAGYGVNILNRVNDIYKGVKPFISPLIESSSYGKYINKGLDYGSKLLEKVQPITNTWIENDDKEKIKDINDKIQRYGGKLTQDLLNKYLDEQDDRLDYYKTHNLSMKKKKTKKNNKTGFNASLDNADLVFGKPLN